MKHLHPTDDDYKMKRIENTVIASAGIIAACVLAAILFTSCMYWPVVIPDPDPIVLDSCDGFHEVTEPAFSGFYLNLDLPLTDTTFYDKNGNEVYPFTSIYYSGINIAGFTDAAYSNADIWVRDGSGAKHFLAFLFQGMNPRGGLTFDQFMTEIRPSVRVVSFSNTGYSCDQINIAIDFLLQDCKAGRDWIRFGGLLDCISQEKQDELTLRGWTLIP